MGLRRLGSPLAARDHERGRRAEEDDRRADPEGGHHPVDERLAGRVAPVVRPDGSEHGHTEHSAELANRVLRARGLALLLGPNRGEDDVRHRRPEHRHPDTRDHERHDKVPVRSRRCRDRRERAEPAGLQRQSDAHQPRAADPVGESAGDRRDEHRHDRPREDAQARAERRVALHGLEELRQQEDRPEHPEEHQERGDVREREDAVLEEAHRQHRFRRAELPEHEQREDESAGH